MKTKIVISTPELKNRAIAIIEALPLEPISEIVIREYKKDRSYSQNRIYWQWLTVIANELGESKESLHERYKDKYLVNIYERDDQEYAEMIQSLRNIYTQGMKVEAVNLRKKIVALTSTTTATIPQMTEYLDCIDHNAAELGIRLPVPEDL